MEFEPMPKKDKDQVIAAFFDSDAKKQEFYRLLRKQHDMIGPLNYLDTYNLNKTISSLNLALGEAGLAEMTSSGFFKYYLTKGELKEGYEVIFDDEDHQMDEPAFEEFVKQAKHEYKDFCDAKNIPYTEPEISESKRSITLEFPSREDAVDYFSNYFSARSGVIRTNDTPPEFIMGKVDGVLYNKEDEYNEARQAYLERSAPSP